jgi:hypothetical protein
MPLPGPDLPEIGARDEKQVKFRVLDFNLD